MTTLAERITIDPEICHGKPTIRGLRYPVELILELLSAGMTHEEILDDYSGLEPGHPGRARVRGPAQQGEADGTARRMKFMEDAQLPRRIALMLRGAGCDAVHTLDLPEANRTTDSAILNLAERGDRVVITKDADFVNSFHLVRRPRHLLLISTGNITNAELFSVLLPNLTSIVDALPRRISWSSHVLR